MQTEEGPKKIRLQIEIYGILRFVVVLQDPNIPIEQLISQIEVNIFELYSFQAKVLWLKV